MTLVAPAEDALAALPACEPADPAFWAAKVAGANQPELRALFKTLLHKPTRSNNLVWLRRKVLEAACATPEQRLALVRAHAQQQAGGAAGAARDASDAAAAAGSSLRKSNRPLKPRVLDLLPSGAWHLAPGTAAVGRRLRVHWPDEMEWFAGQVMHFDAETGRHHVVYDDGDSEELLLAAESIEWLQPQHAVPLLQPGGSVDQVLSPEGDFSAGRRLVRKEETAFGRDPAWPRVGDLLWGRIKGHGWWPGRAVRSDTDKQVASGSVSVSFFDNTSGWVLRSDCLPFAENYETLHSRKKVPAFIQAAKLAWLCWTRNQDTRVTKKRCSGGGRPDRDMPAAAKRPRSDGGVFASVPASPVVEELVPSPPVLLRAFAPPAALLPPSSRSRGRRSLPLGGRNPSKRRKPRAAPPRGYTGGGSLAATKPTDVTGLARRLDDLQTRLGPIAAQAHERVAEQLRMLLHPASLALPASTTSGWASHEQQRLLSQLEALERMPRSPAFATPPATCAASPKCRPSDLPAADGLYCVTVTAATPHAAFGAPEDDGAGRGAHATCAAAEESAQEEADGNATEDSADG